MKRMMRLALMALGCLEVLSAASGAMGQAIIAGARAGRAGAAGLAAGGSTVRLPYTLPDNSGGSYYLYANGMFRMNGNNPVYSQAAQLQINNNSLPNVANAQAKLDEKTGEIIIENLQSNNVMVTRRILINKNEAYVRYVDIFKGTGAGDTQINLLYYTNFNYSVQSAVNIEDPKRKGQNLAWVGQMNNNQSCVELFGGKGAKWTPTVQFNQGNSQVNLNAATTIPAGKEIAIMHVHHLPTSVEAGKKWAMEIKESKLMATVPANIRRLILNFAGGQSYIGDVEIIRGDALDIIELKGGDVMKGTIKDASYKLQTFYGPVELKADTVIGFVNTVDIKPRQLFVTQEGEIFGGVMDASKVTIQMSSGQTTDVPLSQISRVGYRKRDNEPEDWTFDNGLVLLRTGERIVAAPPANPLNVMTRYGALKMGKDLVNSVVFVSDDHGVHEITLSDGTKLSCLVGDETFEMKLPNQVVKFPASSVIRLQFAKPLEDMDPNLPILSMANGDTIVGVVDGTLKLDTSFNTLDIMGSEIKKITKLANSPSGVQVQLWDETSISGLLQEQALTMKLNCGLTLKTPVAMMAGYLQPRPAPSANALDKIRKLVNQLNSDDWKLRDNAQEELSQMGIVTLGVLKQMRGSQPPEAQQRIDQIIKEIEKNPGPSSEAAPAAEPRLTTKTFTVPANNLPPAQMEHLIRGLRD